MTPVQFGDGSSPKSVTLRILRESRPRPDSAS